MDALDGLQWGTRLFLVLVFLGIFAVAALPVVFIAKPVVTEALRAHAASDWWLPFLPDPQGAYGPLAANHWWSVFRADERGSGGALAWRWAFWAVMGMALAGISAWIVVLGLRLLRLGWG